MAADPPGGQCESLPRPLTGERLAQDSLICHVSKETTYESLWLLCQAVRGSGPLSSASMAR